MKQNLKKEHNKFDLLQDCLWWSHVTAMKSLQSTFGLTREHELNPQPLWYHEDIPSWASAETSGLVQPRAFRRGLHKLLRPTTGKDFL